MYNILEHKKVVEDNIKKAFGNTSEDIEKAKWQIGEVRVDSRGIAHECYEYTADGKPRLRRVKKNKSTSTSTNGGDKKSDDIQTLKKRLSDAKQMVLSAQRKVTSATDASIKSKMQEYYNNALDEYKKIQKEIDDKKSSNEEKDKSTLSKTSAEVEIDNDEYKKQYDIVLKQLMSGSDEDKHAVNFGISAIRSNISNTKKELKELKETRPGAKKAIQKLEFDLVKFHSQEKAFNDALKTSSDTKKKKDVTIQEKIDEARKKGFSLYSDGKKEITITKREDLHDRSENYYNVRFRVRNEKGDNFTQDETVKVKPKELTESYIEKLAKEKFSNKKEVDTQSKKKVGKGDSEVSSLFKKVNSAKDKHQVNEKVKLDDGLEISVKYSYTDRFIGGTVYDVKIADRKNDDFVKFSVESNKLTESYLKDRLEETKKHFKREAERKKVIDELDKVAKKYYVENFSEDERGGGLQVNLAGKAYGDSREYDEVVRFDKMDKVYDKDMYDITNYLKKKYKNDSRFNKVFFHLYLD